MEDAETITLSSVLRKKVTMGMSIFSYNSYHPIIRIGRFSSVHSQPAFTFEMKINLVVPRCKILELAKGRARNKNVFGLVAKESTKSMEMVQ